MRDIAVTLIILGAIPYILKRPVIGAYMWVWVGLMNPHRLTWGFAFNMPFAMLIAVVTLFSIMINKKQGEFPLTRTSILLLLFVFWMNLTTVVALDPIGSLPAWNKVMKIFFMLLVVMYLVREKEHIKILAWIVALSVAFYGIKGGVHVIVGGGMYRVYGPAGSFIEENNSLALANIMILPMMLYIYHQMGEMRLRWNMQRWLRWGMVGGAILCGFSILGSHSRGGFLAVMAMLAFLWLKTKNKIVTGMFMLMLVPVAINFMPEHWTERMHTILEYQEDGSAQGRLNAWMMAINLTADRPITGGGFEIYTQSVFDRWAPLPSVRAAHSIYFSILGEHGYVGLLLFLLFWFMVWRDGAFVISRTRNRDDWRWANELVRMIQVGLVGYAVGGAFLSLAYFDLPWYMGAIVILTRRLLERELEVTEGKGWYGHRNRPQRVAGPAGAGGTAAGAYGADSKRAT